MKATDLDFLGPARRARADTAREARLAPEDDEKRPRDFASLIGAEPSAGRPRAAGKAAATAGSDSKPEADAPGKVSASPEPTRATKGGKAEETHPATTDPAADAAAAEVEPDPEPSEPAIAAPPAPTPSAVVPASAEGEGGEPAAAEATQVAALPAAQGDGEVSATAGTTTAAIEPVAAAGVRETPAPARAATAERGAVEPGRADAAKPAHPREAAARDAAATPAAPAAENADATTATAVQAPDTSGATALAAAVPASPLAPEAAWRLVQTPAGHAAARADPRDVLSQISVAVAESHDGTIEIRLDPAELGRVHIALNETEHGMRATVSAERPETVELLRRNSDALTRELSAAGFGAVSVDLAQGGERRDTGAEPRRETFYAGTRGPAEPSAPATATIPANRAGDGPLDIRL